MRQQYVAEFIRREKIIAVIRAEVEKEIFFKAVQSLYEGGLKCIEITMTSPGALSIIEALRQRWQGKGIVIGAGTILDSETCRLAILAGAEFVVSPIVVPEVVTMARQYGVVSMGGGFTPSELHQAWQAGADFVKLFPASLGGPDYIKAILGPLPNLPLVPTGGITQENAKKYLEAGAVALGIGGNLVSKQLLASENYELIRSTAKEYVDSIR